MQERGRIKVIYLYKCTNTLDLYNAQAMDTLIA